MLLYTRGLASDKLATIETADETAIVFDAKAHGSGKFRGDMPVLAQDKVEP